MKNLTKLSGLAVAGAVVAGVFGALPAQAVGVSGCHNGSYYGPPSATKNIGYAECTSMTGDVKIRVKVKCSNLNTYKYGAWVYNSGQRSTYNCGIGKTATTTWHEIAYF